MATQFPQEYLNTLDSILTAETFTAAYQETGAEFVSAKTVNIPTMSIGTSLGNYNGAFGNDDKAEIAYEAYTLSNDKEYSFSVDAVDDIDENHLRVANGAAEVQRQLTIPAMDSNFFAKVLAGAGTKKTDTLAVADGSGKVGIKTALRAVRSKFVEIGQMNADLFISSTALSLLEEATDRQWASEGDIHTMIGRYDIFNIYEVPDALLGCDFLAIAGGKNTVKTVIKRAVTRVFAPEQNQTSDGWLCQMRWVYDTIVRKPKKAAIYSNKAAG